MIVALSGVKRCGKDSCADVLVKDYNFQRISLADPIRELGEKVFDIPVSTFLSDDLREKPFETPMSLNCVHISNIIDEVQTNWGFDISSDIEMQMFMQAGFEFKHPRHILQMVGTELLRNNIDKDIFLKLADKRIEKIDKNIIITDCRFANEREWFKNKGAILCLIKRPSLTVSGDLHASENDLGEDKDYDIIMNNDGSLSRFQIDISNWAHVRLGRRSY